MSDGATLTKVAEEHPEVYVKFYRGLQALEDARSRNKTL